MNSLAGKIAIVTGGASGIGEATSLLFAQAGAKVVIGDVQDGGRVAKEIGGEFLRTDVRQSSDVKALVDFAVSKHGRLDVLFNNAGIEIHGPLIATDDAAHRNLIDINVNGVFYGLKYGIQAMLSNPGPTRGSVINTASVAGLLGAPGLGSYNAAKHAVVGLTRNACLEYGMLGIRVNAVCPGVINTPMAAVLAPSPELIDRIGKAHALGRIGEATEVARAVLFLASDDASFITGAALTVDGGFSVGPSPAAGMTEALG
jgi:NAD(P)-dependent dehydrogenase (short-subunit alcohol dehydrogenase family)